MATRVCAGKHDSLGYGLYVSKVGKNAQTATDIDLIFNSGTAYGSGQIHQIIDITCGSTAPLYEGTGTIVGLAYIPFIHVVEYTSAGIKGIKSWWGRSAGGGSGGGSGGGMGMGGGGGQGGRSQVRWSDWRAKVTNTQITIQSWSGAITDGNYNYTSSIHNNTSLSWPTNTSGRTFRCFVYRIPATA